MGSSNLSQKMSLSLALLFMSLTQTIAQTCQSSWTSFVINDNSGNELFSIAENTGAVKAKAITATSIQTGGKNIGNTVNTLQTDLAAAQTTITALQNRIAALEDAGKPSYVINQRVATNSNSAFSSVSTGKCTAAELQFECRTTITSQPCRSGDDNYSVVARKNADKSCTCSCQQ